MTQTDIKQLVANGGSRFLTFSLGGEEFAIPLLAVKEVIAVPGMTPMPFSQKHFLGIMNLRGQVIPVIDLCRKLEIKPLESKSEKAVIICDLAPYTLGIQVDSINSVVAPSASEISPRPDAFGSRNKEFVFAVYRREKALVLLLDIAKALDSDDFHLINQSVNQRKAS